MEITVGDVTDVVHAWSVPSDENEWVQVEATPISASAIVVRTRTGERIADGEAEISGNETSYTLPPEVTRRPANYIVFVSAVFADDTRITQRTDLNVKPLR